MAKISDFGNTWGNFLPGRNSRCTFSQTPLTPTWEKSGKLTPPPENFSARDSSSNVQNQAFGKPLSKIFCNYFARVLAAIDHSSESCLHHLLSAGPYCPLPSYVKIEAKWKHFLKIVWYAAFNIVFRGYCLHMGSAPFICPPYLHGENQRFWKHLSKKIASMKLVL